ncbi:YesL family protein [Bacillus sp. Marseille-P3800]|uniref:YesL family protein n=1 Tax=Bacillus sp. Marseille-P3800 TaxID=2014782 RepID=UPI000C06F709|nr:DUF624 domain-containing protein [Bacillus sp. Marseille-P3800]
MRLLFVEEVLTVYQLFFQISDWVYKMIKVNLLWVVGLIGGGIFLGLMPATTATFAVTRKWSNGDLDAPIGKVFWETYRGAFFTTNIIGTIYISIITILVVNLRITVLIPGTLMMILHYFILFILLIFLISLVLFFNLYTNYKFSISQYVFQSTANVFYSPMSLIMMFLGFLCIGWLLYQIPGLILFFSAVLPAYWSTTICKKRFQKIENQLSGRI